MIKIKLVKSKSDKKKFINLQYDLYKSDPNFVPPLKIDRMDLISEKKNPFFNKAKAQLFLAYKDNKPVGRISAHINYAHNERYNEETGHFGFFDSINDSAVAKALFQTAENWLKAEGMKQIVGPFNFCSNEESGLLIEGFDTKPFPYMTHNFPYYKNLLEECGFKKVKDLIAWFYDSTLEVPEPAMQIAEFVRKYPNLTVREVNMKDLENEVNIIADVFNSAWSKNWGFVPWTESEVKKAAKDFKLILDPKLALIAEVDGKPAAISIAIPNYHEAIYDLKGKLFPFGLFKLLYRLKIKKPKSARLALLGIKKEFRNDVLQGLSVLLYTEMHKRSQELGHWGGELSWTLDDNDKINNGISLMGGKPYKKYRVFRKKI